MDKVGQVRLMYGVCLESRSRIIEPRSIYNRDYRNATFDVPVALFVCVKTYRRKLERLMRSVIELNATRAMNFPRDVFGCCSRWWQQGKWIEDVDVEDAVDGMIVCDRYAGDALSAIIPAGDDLVEAVGEWLALENAGENVWLGNKPG